MIKQMLATRSFSDLEAQHHISRLKRAVAA
jgi:hypothetical protein